MTTRSTYGRLIGGITGSGEPAAPLTQLLDEHLSEVSGGRCGCRHSSSSSHMSTISGTNHDSRTDCTVQR
ncbi:hypothetical protein [Paracoccus sp. MC1862]|uniref:hypothetical protein n=1 Tax=Paracoccus sp. MC1862 TaxID=2760307 RepID=UPI0016005722|nr:hypothetical protein [Paracoccus sp. MC1862]MBB1499359.1 hypothetical protein [Paracoccus sp. MC1862]QQO44624.1 hypothetical protein JGR78_14990 [Paracoccus sp. MC1862]